MTIINGWPVSYSVYGTLKNPHWSMATNFEYRSLKPFTVKGDVSIWEKFPSGTKNHKQTNKQKFMTIQNYFLHFRIVQPFLQSFAIEGNVLNSPWILFPVAIFGQSRVKKRCCIASCSNTNFQHNIDFKHIC